MRCSSSSRSSCPCAPPLRHLIFLPLLVLFGPLLVRVSLFLLGSFLPAVFFLLVYKTLVSAPRFVCVEAHPQREADVVQSCKVKSGGPEFEVKLSAAGIRRKDLAITILNNIVTIKGESQTFGDTARIDRSLMLPAVIDLDTLSVEVCDGLIRISAKKKVAKTIPVTAPVEEATASAVKDQATETPEESPEEATAKERDCERDHDEFVQVSGEAKIER